MLDMIFPCNIYLILAMAAFIFIQSLPRVREAQSNFIRNGATNFGWIIYFIPLVGFSWFYLNVTVVLAYAHKTFVNCILCFDHKLLLIPSLSSLHFINFIRKVEYNAAAFIVAILRWIPVLTTTLVLLGAYYKPALLTIYANTPELDFYSKAFFALLLFKFLKVIVHAILYLAYRPARVPQHCTIDSRDITVIVPTVGNFGPEFQECIRSILANNPRQIIISVVGPVSGGLARTVCNRLDSERCRVIENRIPNKRSQVVAAVNAVRTKITCFSDDHAFWPTTFLESALIPFENPAVGLVDTAMHIRRDRGGSMLNSLLNYIACLYLERHNFECTASNNIDGGVFVIPGRTSLARTHIIRERHFQDSFLNETWMFGTVGPMSSDDDNFIIRWMVTYGHKIVFHNAANAFIETTHEIEGDLKSFQRQLNRWARTTWRSNSTSLFSDRTVWFTQPWSVYAVYISAFVNLGLFYDTALFYTLYRAFDTALFPNFIYLALALFLSKMVKPLPFYMRNPSDLLLIPVGIAFGYYHSLVKLYALFTCMNISERTRQGIDGSSSAPDNKGTPTPVYPSCGGATGSIVGVNNDATPVAAGGKPGVQIPPASPVRFRASPNIIPDGSIASVSPISPGVPVASSTPSSPATPAISETPAGPKIGTAGSLPTPAKSNGPKVFRKGSYTTPRKEALNVDYKKYY